MEKRGLPDFTLKFRLKDGQNRQNRGMPFGKGAPKKCPKCDGKFFRDYDEWKCVNCGMRIYAGPEVSGRAPA